MSSPKSDKTSELVILNQSSSSKELTKENYYRFINHRLDDYSDLQFSPEEAKRITSHLQKLSTGSTAMVPMYCAGPQCIFASRCPLQMMGKAPLNRQCLIETELLKDWIIKYFDEYDIDPNNFTEVAYINELAEIEIYLMRLNMSIAKVENSELVIDQVAGFATDGTPIIQKQLSPFMEQKERLQNRRSKIIKLMVGDRQEKYKKEAALKIKLDKDPSQQMAAARQKLENLHRQLEKQSSISPQDLIDSNEE